MNFNQDTDDDAKLPWGQCAIEGEELQQIQGRGASVQECWHWISKDEIHHVRILVTREAPGPDGVREQMLVLTAQTHSKRRLPTDFEERAAIHFLQWEATDREAIAKGLPKLILFGQALANIG